MKNKQSLFFQICLILAIAIFVILPSPYSASATPPKAASPPGANVGKGAADGKTTFWVLLREKADLRQAHATKDWKARGNFVVDQLKKTADSSQAGLRGLLKSRGIEHHPFWIANAIRVTADKATMKELEARPEVAKIIPAGVYSIPKPIKGSAQPGVNGVEWNIDRIRAPQVWSTLGIRGDGIVIANIDSGVQYDHPALAAQYRGNLPGGSFDHNYNWFDPSLICGNPSTIPCDNIGHGTHTMGTMVGDDGAANQIGVAPGAKWIAAKGCEDYGCSDYALLAAGQWVLAPTDLSGQNPRPDLRPHIVNNSWGGGPGNDFYQWMVEAWTASGIFPAFSNGNSGPACGTAGSPGDYLASYSAGAFDSSDSIAWFSSRGPSVFGGDEIKPNLSAPGVDVRSSVPYNGYAWNSGTSMASPHVAGTVALMWSGAPNMQNQVEATRAFLDNTAIDVEDLICGGTSADNNVWGEGRLDAYAAVLAVLGTTGTLQGTVTDAGTGMPVAGAKIRVMPRDRSASSDVAGFYSFVLPIGTYDVTASAFGFQAQTSAGVAIAEGATTVQDFALTAAPSHRVSGTVRNDKGEPVPNATVTLLETPIPSDITDSTGSYNFPSVPDGDYTVKASTGGCNDPQTQPLTVDGEETLDFTLPQRADAFGYTCQQANFDYIPASDDLGLYGDDNAIQIMELPFPFTLYGQTYNTAFVSTNGFLNFLNWTASLGPRFIPDPNLPNAAIYPFWDDLYVDFGVASVRKEVLGTAPDRRFVIEWRNVAFCCISQERISFEVILYEKDGSMLMQYQDIDANDREKGINATVGIENETGTVALQYSFNQPVIENGLAVRYVPPPFGFVQGKVTDESDGLGIEGATVRVLKDGNQVKTTKTGPDGSYRMLVLEGKYTLEATAASPNYSKESVDNIVVPKDQVITQDFVLKTAGAAVSPTILEFIVPEAQTVTQTRMLHLSNTGSMPLNWELLESGGAKINITSTLALPRNPNHDANARTTQGLYLGVTQSGWSPAATGDILKSWESKGVGLPWGVGYTTNVWLSDPYTGDRRNFEFTIDGDATGRNWPMLWEAAWNADMAYDAGRNLMCQVAVGGDNGIHCWDPDTGEEKASFSGPWAGISQRGLAYRPDDDTFYVGGWNEGIIYHIRGLSGPNPGQVIGQCPAPDYSISGLAWNRLEQILWEATNSYTDTLYALKPDTCEVVATLAHPNPYYNGAGLEMDEPGNLWMVSQYARTVYLVDSGIPDSNDVPWLLENPVSGTVPAHGQQDIAVTVSGTENLKAGTYSATLVLQNNSGRNPKIRVPVRLVVTPYTQAVNAGGPAYTDTVGTKWAADQPFKAGSWGYVNRSTTQSTKKAISDTYDDPLYQDLRSDILEYRIDLPRQGMYEVELDFAEIKPTQFDHRRFDIQIEGNKVEDLLDIALRVGSFRAYKRTYFVTVTDGQLNVRFVPYRGYGPAIVNALRITRIVND